MAGIAAAALAGGVASLPVSDSFESLADGEDLTARTGWSVLVGGDSVRGKAAPDHGLRTAYLPAVGHTRVVDVNGSGVHTVNGAGAGTVYVDMLARPLELRIAGRPTINDPGPPKMALYVNSDGHPVMYHSYFDTNQVPFPDYSIGWSEFPQVTLTTNDWVHLTWRFDFTTETQFYDAYFQFMINGSAPLTGALAYVTIDSDNLNPDGGTWFMAGNNDATGPADQIVSVAMVGRGQWDDYTVSASAPGGGGGPTVTSNGTPHAWLDQYGLATNGYDAADWSDMDGDGQPAWMEYYAGTLPNDGASRFEVVRMDGWEVVWLGGTNGSSNPFRVYRSTNLLAASNGWMLVQTQAHSASGTNQWSDPAMTNLSRAIYRVAVPMN